MARKKTTRPQRTPTAPRRAPRDPIVHPLEKAYTSHVTAAELADGASCPNCGGGSLRRVGRPLLVVLDGKAAGYLSGLDCDECRREYTPRAEGQRIETEGRQLHASSRATWSFK